MRAASLPALFALLGSFSVQCAAADDGLRALSYHDVQDDPLQQRTADALTIATGDLVAHFAWLREHGYRPVGIDEVLAAREGRGALPAKAVLLTFDDGYRSFYTRVFPLLKLFGYPAVVAPLVRWIETGADEAVAYGERPVARDRFLSWEELREMQDSGLVEVASHSYDLHHGIAGNPQHNLQPAATTRRYDRSTAAYEDDESYRARIRADLERSARIIAQRLGRRPRVLVWPYGAYNTEAAAIAAEVGMPITMGLEEGLDDGVTPGVLGRRLVADQADLAELVTLLRPDGRAQPIRVVHVDLDYVYDPDPARQEANLGLLLDRIKALQINTVYLQAFADPDGDGNADALYFPNRHLPVRADLFSRAAWQLRTRAGVRVYAWIPVLSFVLADDHPLAERVVARAEAQSPPAAAPDYHRLTPFSPETRALIAEIYEDLARYAHFDGLLFHDDAYLSDLEDASAAALRVYARDWGLPASIAEIRAAPALSAAWTRHKTQALVDLTHELRDRVRRYRPGIRTARNLYARVVMEPESERWFAQSLEVFVAAYDYAAVMAMPYMEGAADPQQWLGGLAARIAIVPGALERTVFELQSVDWRYATPIGTATLAGHMRTLQARGALNYGYYPDDFVHAYPEIAGIRPAISLSTFPFPRQP